LLIRVVFYANKRQIVKKKKSFVCRYQYIQYIQHAHGAPSPKRERVRGFLTPLPPNAEGKSDMRNPPHRVTAGLRLGHYRPIILI